MAVDDGQLLGIPPVAAAFPGIDRIGGGCRIAASVTVMRLPADCDGFAGIGLGDEVSLYDRVRLVIGNPCQHPDTGLSIGRGTIVNVGGYLSGEGGLDIADDCLIGPYVKILSAGHAIGPARTPINRNPLTYGRIVIGRGAWIGAGATILEGVSVGAGAVVGAGALVTKDIPPYAVAVGVPARVRRFRGEPVRGGWRSRLARFISRRPGP